MLVRVADFGGFLGRVHAVCRRGPDTIERVGLGEAELERTDPGGADELQAAGTLDVHATTVRTRAERRNVAEDGQRYAAAHDVVREQTKEYTALGRLAPHDVSQRLGQTSGAGDWPQIEEDRRLEYLLRRRHDGGRRRRARITTRGHHLTAQIAVRHDAGWRAVGVEHDDRADALISHPARHVADRGRYRAGHAL